jgi:putative transcriptional regulator
MIANGLRFLCILLVALLAPSALSRAELSGPDDKPAPASLVGQLLVASPDMGDPRFEHAVILVVQHGSDGALGLVINNPVGEQPVAEVLKALGEDEGDAAGNVRIFLGGPVQPEAGFVIHGADYRLPETIVVTDRVSVTSSAALLKDIGSGRGPAKSLVVFGYAGWSAGQLEHEMQMHVWALAEADPALVFDEDREKVWELAWQRRTQHS